jgi:hypothetical protein
MKKVLTSVSVNDNVDSAGVILFFCHLQDKVSRVPEPVEQGSFGKA